MELCSVGINSPFFTFDVPSKHAVVFSQAYDKVKILSIWETVACFKVMTGATRRSSYMTISKP